MTKLYHGTFIDLNVGDSLKTDKATSRALDPITREYKQAISTSSSYQYAESYALDRNSHEIRDSFVLEPGGRPLLAILDSKDAAYAYVYELDSTNFFLDLQKGAKGTNNDEYVSFEDAKIIKKHKIGAKELLAMKHKSGKDKYEVRIKKANFQEGKDKIIEACRKNSGQLDELLAKYTINAKDML